MNWCPLSLVPHSNQRIIRHSSRTLAVIHRRLSRKSKEENRTPSQLRFYPNPPLITLDNTLANRQPDSRSRVFCSRVKTFEQSEDLLLVFRFDADTVVAHRYQPTALLPFGLN